MDSEEEREFARMAKNKKRQRDTKKKGRPKKKKKLPKKKQPKKTRRKVNVQKKKTQSREFPPTPDEETQEEFLEVWYDIKTLKKGTKAKLVEDLMQEGFHATTFTREDLKHYNLAALKHEYKQAIEYSELVGDFALKIRGKKKSKKKKI